MSTTWTWMRPSKLASNNPYSTWLIWQRRVQRTACDLEWLCAGRLQCERSVPWVEHRALDQPRDRSGRLAGGDGQHQLLRGGSGTLRRVAGELLYQVGDEPVSRRCVRDMERLVAKWDKLLSTRQRHAGEYCEEAAVDRE